MTRNRGFLVGVQSYGQQNTLEYGGNGMLSTVRHANGVTDSIVPDGGMQRPKTISVSGATENSGCTSPVVAADPVDAPLVNGSATLTAKFAADTDTVSHTVVVSWYAGARGDKTTPVSGATTTNSGGAVTSSLTVSPAATTSYWAEAVSNCSNGTVADTAAAIVTKPACSTPIITVQPVSTAVTYGNTAALAVTSPTAGVTYQWYSGDPNGSHIELGGFTSAAANVSTPITKTYYVKVTNACGGFVNSSVVTVTIRPQAPAWTTAAYARSAPGSLNGTVTVRWAPVTAAVVKQYQVRRMCGTNSTTILSTAINANPVPTSMSIGVSDAAACVYSVKTIDKQDAASDTWSPIALATQMTFKDDPLNGGAATPIQGVHFSELRRAIDAVRTAAGLPPAWTSYDPLTGPVMALHLIEMRTAIEDARRVLNLGAPGWTRPVITPGVTGIWAVDVMELRNSVR